MVEPHTISEAAAALRAGKVTSVDLVTGAIALAQKHDETVGAFMVRYDDAALEQAAAADADLADGIDHGPLHGVPLGIKDIISTRDGETTAQSLVLDREWGRGIGDAPVVARLRGAGAVIMGKTTTSEFALGSPDRDRPFPIPRNPWDPERWAGGSSSGSAAGIAAGMMLGALGTDTGGSIRIPAAFCGVTGLMPTFGRVPKSGCVPLGYSLDHIGPLARSARDAALLMSVLAGADDSDPSSVAEPVPDYAAALDDDGDLTGVRIGYTRLTEYAGTEDPALPGLFADAVETFAARGAELVEVELPYYEQMRAACVLILVAEAVAYHLPDLQTRWADYAPSTRRRLGMAFSLSAADYVQAQRARAVAQHAVADLFDGVDLVVTPTIATVASRLDELDVVALEDGGVRTIHTAYWDAMGNPVISVPMGFGVESMPIGLQIAGRPFDESLVLRAADAFQQRTSWHERRPPLSG
jgi:aspartyl-tRNA(Asn)/glutamyl-tRNA(Gln) amidotransferase subunit A